jgi:MSHA biogenesis protein MshQ
LSAVTTSGGASAVTGGAMGSSVTNVAPVFTFTQGVGIIDTSANNAPAMPLFAFTPKPTATTGTRPTQFYVRAIDTDLVTSQRTGAVEQPVTAVSGRLLVPNVDGSPSSALPVTVQAQFYHPDRGGYVFNPMYTAAAPTPAGYMRFDRCQKGLSSNAATYACTSAAQLQLVAPGTTAFAAGQAKFRLAAPAQGNISGSVNLTLLQPCSSGTCVQWIDYLPSTTGKLTFGVYRSGPVIYTREMY